MSKVVGVKRFCRFDCWNAPLQASASLVLFNIFQQHVHRDCELYNFFKLYAITDNCMWRLNKRPAIRTISTQLDSEWSSRWILEKFLFVLMLPNDGFLMVGMISHKISVMTREVDVLLHMSRQKRVKMIIYGKI